MQNVLKVQVALVDPEKNWERMDEIYNTFSPPTQSPPSRISERRVSGLPGSWLQIDCIAYVD